jgi:Methyltransferase domain
MPAILRLDIGCGSNKKVANPGEVPWFGVDSIAFRGVDKVMDITQAPWPFSDNSVEEFHCSHVIEHLTWPQRITFFNELYRVLKPGAKGQLILPHWASMRYYGDPTHQSPMSEFAFYYLSRAWRCGGIPPGSPAGTPSQVANAPHTDILYNKSGYDCNFEVVWGHSLHPLLQTRNQEYVQHALTFWKESAQDLIANLTKA